MRSRCAFAGLSRYARRTRADDGNRRRASGLHFCAGIEQDAVVARTRTGARAEDIDRAAYTADNRRICYCNTRICIRTGTGAACAEIIREVNDEGIKVNYDAGNVMDYLRVDPLADILKCAEEIRSFCLKDHRVFPKDQDCAPGFGEIDHYRLLAPVASTGRDMALSFENIFLPVVPRPTKPEGVDSLARRAREFMETVIQGVQSKET